MLRPDLMMARTSCQRRFSTRKVSKFRIEFSSAVSVQWKQEIYWTSPSLSFSFHKISLTLLNVTELLQKLGKNHTVVILKCFISCKAAAVVTVIFDLASALFLLLVCNVSLVLKQSCA